MHGVLSLILHKITPLIFHWIFNINCLQYGWFSFLHCEQLMYNIKSFIIDETFQSIILIRLSKLLYCSLIVAFGFYVYSKYYFLTNIAPAKAFPYYQRGIIITNHFLRFSNGFKAKKSTEII